MSYYYDQQQQYNQQAVNSPIGTGQQEQDLAIALKKALSTEESAPKAKHELAPSLINNYRDCKGSGSLWTALKSYPMIGDDIVQYKALILFHKTIRQGHPTVLKDAFLQSNWLDGIVRNTNEYATGPVGGSSYAPMMKAYIQFLKQKLEYHKLRQVLITLSNHNHTRPFFSGTFDYEEFVSLKGVQDPNEGHPLIYETIHDMLGLLEKVDRFAKIIFSNLRSYGANECRIAALVPLVEESFGIYKFIVSMMTAMHMIIGSVEVLAPLRDQFKTHHYNLLKFYAECSQIRYLTSLVSIPSLGQTPPDFLDQGAPTQLPKSTTSQAKAKDSTAEEAFMREQELLFQQQQEKEDEERRKKQLADQMERDRLAQLQAQQQLFQEQERERQAQLLLQQQQQQQQQQQFLAMQGVQQQLEWYRQQNARDKEMMGQYEQRLNSMMSEMGNLRIQAQSSGQVNQLQDEINSWKQKYEALAKLYAQLRKEHLDLLQKFKAIKDSTGKVSDEARRKLEAVETQLKAKTAQVTDIMVERNRLEQQVDQIQRAHLLEVGRITEELAQTKQALTELSLTKGNEVQQLVSRFNQEQKMLEEHVQARQADISRLGAQLADSLSATERLKAGWEEERMVLQAGLDQALEMLKMHQDESSSGMGKRDEKIAILEQKHRDLLFQMMDNVLESCITTVQDSIFSLGGAEDSKSTVSPEFVLVLVEKATQKCADFSSAFVKLANGGDPKDAVTTSALFAQVISELLRNGREMERLIPVDSDDDIIDILSKTGHSALTFFSSVKADKLAHVQPSGRAEHIVNLARQTQFQIGSTTEILERLVSVSSKSKLEGDLSTAVETEMARAAKAIEEASARLQALILKGGEMNVHSAILQAAVALTTAITHLIKCATDSQNEIVSQNKGGQTTTAFYKKNNKWTEGLISAAHSVASSTVHLVSTADGLVQSTQSWEQVVVAAQDVGVSTTQLVAAARVKAQAYSKTQDRLEKAAVAVREATKLVVKAAKDASKLSAENQARQEVGSMSKHEAKVKEMEQQVKILELEKSLSTARYTLGEMRKQNYHEEV